MLDNPICVNAITDTVSNLFSVHTATTLLRPAPSAQRSTMEGCDGRHGEGRAPCRDVRRLRSRTDLTYDGEPLRELHMG
jgi:hypothetical protein